MWDLGLWLRIITAKPGARSSFAKSGCVSQGLQSDREFAETFARSRWRQYRWAASRIRIELMKKGVSKEDLDHALHELFGDQYTVRLHNDTVDEHDLEGEPYPHTSLQACKNGQVMTHAPEGHKDMAYA